MRSAGAPERACCVLAPVPAGRRLRSYSRLRELRIFQTYQNRPLPAGLEAAISQLTELQTLVLRGKEMPQDLLAAVLGSTQLKERSLCADSYEQPQALLELTCLRQLTSLSLSLRSNDPRSNDPRSAIVSPTMSRRCFIRRATYSACDSLWA